MTPLTRIKQAGFKVILFGDVFDVSPSSSLTQQQRDFLKSHKAEIIAELKREKSTVDKTTDDRHYCRECVNLSGRRCVVQKFKPVDDIPRRCNDFAAPANFMLARPQEAKPIDHEQKFVSCGQCLYFKCHNKHGKGSGLCVIGGGYEQWSETVHQCKKFDAALSLKPVSKKLH